MDRFGGMRARVFGALLTLLLLAGASPFGAWSALAQDEPIRVVTTIAQIGDVARNVGGDRVAVESLMGSGIDPHVYQASEGDIGTLLEADLILYNGLNLEGRMADVLVQLADQKPVVAVSELVPEERLLEPEEFEGAYDPHIWFDPTLWAFAVQRVEQALVELDPANEATYAANAAAYLAELETRDAAWQDDLATIPETARVLVTAHDAFNYFGQRYDFEVVGLQGISTESEAGVADIQRLADLIAERQVPAIFVESSVSPRTIEALQEAARERGADVEIGGELYSDAMGAEGTPAGTYLGMVDHNVTTIVTALGGDANDS